MRGGITGRKINHPLNQRIHGSPFGGLSFWVLCAAPSKLGPVLCMGPVFWVIQGCDRRRVLRAILLATVATLLAGIVGAIALASVGML